MKFINHPNLSKHKPYNIQLVLLLIVFGLSAVSGYCQTYINQSNTDNKLYIDDLHHTLNFTNSYRDFIIPDSAIGKFIYLSAKGADGGTISYKKNLTSGKGGQGATVSGEFKIGSGENEIPAGSVLRIIIGQKGESYRNHGQTANHSAGGGGGTGVLYLPPSYSPSTTDPDKWVILMVAGGGGGGFAQWGFKSRNGDPGNDGELGTGHDYGYKIAPDNVCKDVVSSNYSRWGGDSGAGTSYKRHGDYCKDAWYPDVIAGYPRLMMTGAKDQAAEGGFKIGSNGKFQPLGGRGGRALPGGNHGGFGFGGGGYGGGGEAGGGGGYAGGDQGDQLNGKQAGGGGSYIKAAFALNPTKEKHGVIEVPLNGKVIYNISAGSLNQP